MPYLYILHFDEPIEHAQHYTGCSANLKERLLAHATGHGANLTREFYDRCIEFELSYLAIAEWEIERRIKDQHNGPQWCPICTPVDYRTLPHVIEYPLENLRKQWEWNLRSETLRGEA